MSSARQAEARKDTTEMKAGYLRNTTPAGPDDGQGGGRGKEEDLKEVTRAWYRYYRKLKDFRRKYKVEDSLTAPPPAVVEQNEAVTPFHNGQFQMFG